MILCFWRSGVQNESCEAEKQGVGRAGSLGKVKVKSLSRIRLCDPMDCSLPGFSIHGIFQQEYSSGLPFPSPGDLPNPGIEPQSPAL